MSEQVIDPFVPLPLDPLYPAIDAEVGGHKLQLCFTLGALAAGRAALRKQGIEANVLVGLGQLDADTLPALFVAALHRYHPSLTYDAVVPTLTLYDIDAMSDAVLRAWQQAQPAPKPVPDTAEPDNPTQSQS